jgi:hypothetical protein
MGDTPACCLDWQHIDWDLTVLDHTLDDDKNWVDTMLDLEVKPLFPKLFDKKFGNYRKHVILVQDVGIKDIDDYIPSFFDALNKSPSPMTFST